MAKLLEAYHPPDNAYDEMVTATGQERETWDALLETLRVLNPSEFTHRWDLARRLLRENGVTFNIYGADKDDHRQWGLDPLPLLISAEQWKQVERGLEQRTHLLSLLIEDVYGAQRCLKEGWIPVDLVYGHPGFQRPCHGLCVPPECRLLIHSVDIVRNPDGQFMVLRDRAETPGGAGYALENRLALKRVLPEFFEGRGIRKLASFFNNLRNTVHELARRRGGKTSAVFLTPGTLSQTYFEQAYLAQYLGFPLVQGDDLTVRNNRVYKKLLGGLEPVDVIVKRLRDGYCDPLELRSDSVLGIPGLVQAIKAGNVIVANSIGSGWVDTPALQVYLPELCRRFLGEELLLPGVPSWWCGEPESLDYVLENLSQLVVKPVFGTAFGEAVFMPAASEKERQLTLRKLKQNPSQYVAQTQLSPSTTPCFGESGLEPRSTLLRTFITRYGQDYSVMPGALTLASSRAGSVVASLTTGASSKDTWILEDAEARAPEVKVVTKRQPMALSRGGGDIASRVANNLFWLGRYLERGEGLCRILRYSAGRLNQQNEAGGEQSFLHYLINPRWKPHRDEGDSLKTRVLNLLNKESQPDGLAPCLDNIRRLTGVVRDRLTNDSWRLSNRLWELASEKPEAMPDVQAHLDDMVTTFSAFSGLFAENTSRTYGWRFLEIGRRLERAIATVGFVRRALSCRRDTPEALVLEVMLEIADASRTYRRRYPAGLQTAPVIDLLVADEGNPRSVLYQLLCLEDHFDALPVIDGSPPGDVDKLLLRCIAAVKLADVYELAESFTEGKRRAQLNNLLRDLGRDIPSLSDLIAKRYFNHLVLTGQEARFGREVLP